MVSETSLRTPPPCQGSSKPLLNTMLECAAILFRHINTQEFQRLPSWGSQIGHGWPVEGSTHAAHLRPPHCWVAHSLRGVTPHSAWQAAEAASASKGSGQNMSCSAYGDAWGATGLEAKIRVIELKRRGPGIGKVTAQDHVTLEL